MFKLINFGAMSAKNKNNVCSNLVAYSDVAIRNNLAVVEYCRTSMAALSGCTAGIILQKLLPIIK